MPVTGTQPRIPLSAGAQRTNLTSQGLLKILLRTDSAIREDGRWYADPLIIDQIATARRVLGIEKTRESHKRSSRIAKRLVPADASFVLTKPVRPILKKKRQSARFVGQSKHDNYGLTAASEGGQPAPALSENRK